MFDDPDRGGGDGQALRRCSRFIDGPQIPMRGVREGSACSRRGWRVWSGDLWPIPVFFEGSDPAWGVFGDARSFVIDSRVAIGVTPDKDEVDGPHQFVGEGDDRFLVAAANDQALVLGAEDGLGSPCGVGGLAQKVTNDGVAVAGLTAFALAGRLVVAGTQGAPRRQARRGSRRSRSESWRR